MANTYTQIFLHLVFSPKFRSSVIQTSWEDELYKYITGVVQGNNHKMLAINGMPDHIHLLIGLHSTQSVSELMQDIKRSSSKWINEKKFLKSRFEWQEGYGAFSYSKSQVKNVIKYITDQKEYHQKTTFNDEYKEILERFDIPFDEKYVFRMQD